jgi:hypothetical protein
MDKLGEMAADFKRNKIRELLDQCTYAQVDLFNRMYRSIDDIQDEKMDRAYDQCLATIEKNKVALDMAFQSEKINMEVILKYLPTVSIEHIKNFVQLSISKALDKHVNFVSVKEDNDYYQELRQLFSLLHFLKLTKVIYGEELEKIEKETINFLENILPEVKVIAMHIGELGCFGIDDIKEYISEEYLKLFWSTKSGYFKKS